jgi:ATP-dependent DNA helicase RecQ
VSSASTLEDILAHYWGFERFRPLQREAIDAILDRRDSLVVMPTGGGKSVCFQAPALVGDEPGVALVVSPLIALMKDQVDGLVESGVPAARLDSTTTADERAATVAALGEGRLRLLYVSPERLVGDGGAGFQRQLARWGVRFIAIDEAHCISHWGHDFRPEYRQLGGLRGLFPHASVHAFTATATEQVRRDIVERLGLQEPVTLVGDFDRPNLIYRVKPRLGRDKQIEECLQAHRGEAGIIYCTSRKDVDTLAATLAAAGHRALPYHAGLRDDERARNQEAFIDERADIVVATVAFGMGVDRPDVRFVVHAGAPKSLEHYQQEAGRAGRDGLEAECLLLYSGADFLKWRRMLEIDGELSEAAVRQLRDMERYAVQMRCRHRALVEHFGQRYAREACGACDWCLHELEPIEDALIMAQKIGSCVVRVKQRWGIGHVTAVLEGKTTPQITAQGHETLTTFGLLRGTPTAEIRGYIEQLVSLGFLARTSGEYPTLQMTERGMAMLRGQVAASEVALCRQPRPVRGRRAERSMTAVERESWAGVDRDLFEALRRTRLEIARARHVPPYVIFHDSTLREMARLAPHSIEALRHVHGVGDRKAEQFGPRFLEVIAEFADQGRRTSEERMPS